MSEPLLKAILQLFAIVAKEDTVTQQERYQIQSFLSDHLNKNTVSHYMDQFDRFSDSLDIPGQTARKEEQELIEQICHRANTELTQKQKLVIILELMGVILADGHISPREQELVQLIASSFNISAEETDLIKAFVLGKNQEDFRATDFLIIDDNEHEQQPYRHLYRHGLKGFIAILRLKNADTFFIKKHGPSTLYLNGVPLRSGIRAVLAAGSTIRPEKAAPVYYGDVIGQFITKSSEERITFVARDVSFNFKNGKQGLVRVNIAEESGKLIGLMGASGAGKSTLLNVLNGIEKPAEGKVLINNIDIHKQERAVKGIIGYVPQDDLLIEELTVYQNLYYAASLCFAHLSDQDLSRLVIKTLSSLGLQDTKNLKVGSVVDKIISGGQRKRLNIGLELLREPSILFVDEPTSGLSSRDSENIMDLLKELSLKGKLIFVVIHQPSSDVFKMFDKLVILDTGGYQIYYGNPVESVVYFKEIINLINSEQGECYECGNVNPEQIFNIIETKVINEYGNFTSERKILPEQWNQYFKEKITIPKLKQEEKAPESTLDVPGRLKQLKVFIQRDVFSKLSNKQYLVINLLEAPVLAFVLAYIVRYYNTYHTAEPVYTFSQNLNMPAYLFMSIIVALFMGLSVSAEEIIRDQKILKREAFLHLSRGSYLSSKIVILFTMSALQTLTFVVVGNAVLEINGMLYTHWLILFSASCMANVLGLNISSAFNSAVTIYIMIPILLIPQLVLSGVVVKFDKLNPELSNTGEVPWVGDLMASRWAFEAAMVSQFKDNAYESIFYLYEKIKATSDYKKVYYIPTLESKLEYNLNHLRDDDEEIKQHMAENLTLLKRELQKELAVVGKDKFKEIHLLAVDQFDSTVYEQTSDFLKKLRAYYALRYKKADQAKDQLTINMTKSPEDRKAFDQLKAHHKNETIAKIVTNRNEPQRIVEANGKLVQKIFPIYKDPEPTSLLDYQSPFYVAKKHFMGRNFDTLSFNLTVIWLMSFFLSLILYFNIPRKLISSIETFGEHMKR